jgi:hypothetical protein
MNICLYYAVPFLHFAMYKSALLYILTLPFNVMACPCMTSLIYVHPSCRWLILLFRHKHPVHAQHGSNSRASRNPPVPLLSVAAGGPIFLVVDCRRLDNHLPRPGRVAFDAHCVRLKALKSSARCC